MTKQQLRFIIHSMIVLLFLGTVYAWSVTRVYVESAFGIGATLSGLPYMTSLVSYSTAMLISGQYMYRYRKQLVYGGALLFVLGFLTSSMVTNIWVLTLTYGVLLGSGVGMIYGVPLYIINQTFTGRVGFYSGLVLLGFGLSNVVMTPTLRFMFDRFGLSSTFFYFSMISLLVFVMFLPTLTKPFEVKEVKIEKRTFDKRKFILLYFVFLFSLISGLMIIGLSYRIGVINYTFDANFVTLAISLFAIGNAISRPMFGNLVDRIGLFKSGFISLALLIFASLLAIFNAGLSPIIFAFTYGVFWIGLGSWISMAPIAIKILFGKDMYAQLYGRLFTAYGIAGIIGTLFSGYILDVLPSPLLIYVLIFVVNVLNLFLLAALSARVTSTKSL